MNTHLQHSMLTCTKPGCSACDLSRLRGGKATTRRKHTPAQAAVVKSPRGMQRAISSLFD